MKLFAIILVLCCVGAYAISDDVEPALAECIDKLKLTKIDDFKELTAEQRKKFMCCLQSKKFNANIDELASELKKSVNQAQHITASSHYTKDSLLEKINKCYNEAGKDACKFVTCLDILSPPFSNFYLMIN